MDRHNFHRSQSYDYCFVVSRPDDLGTLNHRSEAKAVRTRSDDRKVRVEFPAGNSCGPATLQEQLWKRLADRDHPDRYFKIDGHGAFSAGAWGRYVLR
jgi:hypothetical protein